MGIHTFATAIAALQRPLLEWIPAKPKAICNGHANEFYSIESSFAASQDALSVSEAAALALVLFVISSGGLVGLVISAFAFFCHSIQVLNKL